MNARDGGEVGARFVTRRGLLFGGIASAAALRFAGRASATAPGGAKVTTTTLANGARLLVLEEPDAPLAALSVLFDVGAADERAGEQGLTSLLARAWVSGTETMSAALMRFELAASGSAVGAWAAGDHVELWAVCRADPFSVDDAARALLMNLLANATFPDDAVIEAKSDQRRSLLRAQDDLVGETLAALRSRVLPGSVSGQRIDGDERGVAALTPEMVRRYYRHHFHAPARALFVFAGRDPADEVQRLIEAHLNAGGWPRPAADRATTRPAALSPSPTAPTPPPPLPPGLRDLSTGRHAPAPVYALGYLAPGTASPGRTPADWAALRVLDAVLAGGKGSRLFALRDRPPADGPLKGRPVGYDVRSLLEPGRQGSLWAVYVEGCAPDVPPAQIKAALLGELAALRDGSRPVTEPEVARAKALLIGQHARDRQRLKDRAYQAGRAEMLGIGAGFEAEFEARIGAVTAEAVGSAARTLLGGNPAAVHTEFPAP